MVSSVDFPIEEAVMLWNYNFVKSGVFRNVHRTAFELLQGHSSTYSTEELYGYFQHSIIEIETSIKAVTMNATDVEWDKMMILETGGHALSALMLREALIDIPDDHLPLTQDASKISSVWNIVRNIYARGDSLPSNEELQALRTIVQD